MTEEEYDKWLKKQLKDHSDWFLIGTNLISKEAYSAGRKAYENDPKSKHRNPYLVVLDAYEPPQTNRSAWNMGWRDASIGIKR